MDYRFLFYFLRSSVDLLDSMGTGATFRELSAGKLKEVEIPLPPLAEQKRIVAKLDDVHSCLTSSEERLGSEASLVGDARRSSVDRLFAQLDAGMEALEGICDVFADGDWVESKDQSPSGIRLVQTGNIGDGVFKDRREKARWISEDTFVRLNCTEVFPGDVLISRLPDPVGRACLIPETGDRMITAVDCTIVRPKLAILDPEFLVLYTSSSAYEAQVRGKITGTTRDRISRNNLGNLRIPVPTVAQQREIVAKAEEIGSVLLGLEQTISIRRERFGDLRQSVLEAAFRGEF
jgi:type I restriction enzyme S subunit